MNSILLMNRSSKILILIVSMIIASVFLFIFWDFDRRNVIASHFLDLKENEYPQLQIDYTNDVSTHFNELFKDYYGDGTGIRNKDFIEYYSANNKWKKAKLTIDKVDFDIKLKSHGRSPWAHKFGDNFSLAIRFKKDYPFYSKRINLLIYHRIKAKGDILKYLTSKIDLFSPNSFPVVVKINSLDESVFIIEERINNDFFENRNLPMIIFNKGTEGSLIYTGGRSSEALSIELNSILNKSNSISSKLKQQIAHDYSSFNRSLERKDFDSIVSQIDKGYLAKLNFLRLLYGDDGHGFGGGNLEMAYDSINRIFYPIAHRDINSSSFTCEDPFSNLRKTDQKSPFWNLVNSNMEIKEMTMNEVYRFFDSNTKESIEKEIIEIIDKHNQIFNYDYSLISREVDGSNIISNLNCLAKK